jgi:glycosyltransferase involved in cell wall biosynthesis
MTNELPLVSIVIATLNSAAVLENCLVSIESQNYPKAKIETIISDGGSTDKTLELAEKYHTKVVSNKLKTAEAGKAVSFKSSSGDYVAFVDSDNILPYETWLNDMITPLLINPDAIGSEPWEYTLRKEDGFITRYCALIGMNDPFVMFLGNYDRLNTLTGKWTEVPHTEKDFGNYILVTLTKKGIPTIGANGTVFKSSFLHTAGIGDYLFDIDLIAKEIEVKGSVLFIKVKNGIVHTFCESNIQKFALKQRRRVKDFLYHSSVLKDRSFGWNEMDISGRNPFGLIKFVAYCVLVLPLIYQSLLGYKKRPDPAWFFHPLACYITLWEYGWGRLIGFVHKGEASRSNWRQ